MGFHFLILDSMVGVVNKRLENNDHLKIRSLEKMHFNDCCLFAHNPKINTKKRRKTLGKRKQLILDLTRDLRFFVRQLFFSFSTKTKLFISWKFSSALYPSVSLSPFFRLQLFFRFSLFFSFFHDFLHDDVLVCLCVCLFQMSVSLFLFSYSETSGRENEEELPATFVKCDWCFVPTMSCIFF